VISSTAHILKIRSFYSFFNISLSYSYVVILPFNTVTDVVNATHVRVTVSFMQCDVNINQCHGDAITLFHTSIPPAEMSDDSVYG
jgi:hypothetical protein